MGKYFDMLSEDEKKAIASYNRGSVVCTAMKGFEPEKYGITPDISFEDEYNITIKKSRLRAFSGSVEGDYSTATGINWAIMGHKLWAEYLDAIAVVTVSAA